jgi:uncharacterized membrane protein
MQQSVTARLTRLRRPEWLWWPAWAVAIGGFGLYLVFTLARWHRQASASWDLAIFEQAVKGYAYFSAPIVDIKGPGFHQLGDHFSPFLALLGPFYRLWPTPVTLLVAQCFLIALSIIPITLTAKRLLGPAPALLLGPAYALAWGFQSGLSVEFHEYCLAVPILAFALTGLLNGHFVAAACWSVLLLGVKEDLGLTTTAIGLFMLGQGWRRWQRGHRPLRPAGPILGEGDVILRVAGPAAIGPTPAEQAAALREAKIGALTAAIGTVASILILFVVIPAFNPNGHWDYWGRLEGDGRGLTGEGAGASDALTVLPDLLLGLFTPAAKVNTLVLLAALVIGACCVSWMGLIAVPTLLWRFVSPNEGFWGTGWHYSLILMPMVFAAGIDACRRLLGSAAPAVRRYARAVPGLSLAFALVASSQFPFHEMTEGWAYEESSRAGQAAQVLGLIDRGATVATDAGLIIRLPSRATVYWISSMPDEPVDYILIDPAGGGWGVDPGDPSNWGEGRYPGTDYVTIYSEEQSGDPGGYRLAELVR